LACGVCGGGVEVGRATVAAVAHSHGWEGRRADE
jgi:hypothetical protein